MKLTAQERGDVIHNFSYLMAYDTELTFSQFADMVEVHSLSPQAVALVNELRSKNGKIIRDISGNVIVQDW